MKNVKFKCLNIVLVLLLLTACTNDNPVIEQTNQTVESESITTALGELRNQFDSNGNVSNTDNPTGNIVFDFCFNFVYPITLSYNNNTTVDVDNLEGLIDVLISSTNDLYINGIAFPFDVETYDHDTNSIGIETINDEDEFAELLLSCDFDDDNIVCPEEYAPVCVEVTDPNGEVFVITYTNECYASLDGFTEEDFIDDCTSDYYAGGVFDCFSINFPVELITEDGEIITINSEDEFNNAIYNLYIFDFVYPFSITVTEDNVEEIIIINNENDIETILEDCYDGSDCYEIAAPVCVEVIDSNGEITIVTYDNDCYALLDGYTPDDFVDCDDDDDNPGDICDEEYIAEIFEICPFWEANVDGVIYDYVFQGNGTLEIFNPNGVAVAGGTWEIGYDGGQSVTFVVLNLNLDSFTTVWFFINCDGEGNFDVITNGGAASDIQAACD